MKRFIKQSWALFVLDWRRVVQNKLTLMLVIALMILPSLYAWFNIAALWDPYSNTSDIAIAVYSDDETVDVLAKEINIGDEIVRNLKKNDTIGWQFVSSKKELDQGVKKGDFYGGIYLPKHFSQDLISFTKGEIVKPEIEYSVNQKINAIAPKITDKGASTIKETISQEFVATVSETLMGTFNTLGYELDSHSVSIEAVRDKILTLNDNLSTIDGYTQEVVNLNKKMPSYQEKLEKANEFSEYLPEVNQMAAKLVAVNALMPKVQQEGRLILDVQAKIPQIEAAGQQIKTLDEDFEDLTLLFTQVIDEATVGLGVIADVQGVLPEVSTLVETANETLPGIKASLTEVEKALPEISKGLGSTLEIIKIVGSDLSRLTSSLAEFIGTHELTESDKAALESKLTQLSASLTSLSDLLAGMIETLTELQALSGNTQLAGLISQLSTLQSRIAPLQDRIQSLIASIDNLSTAEIQAHLRQISQEATKLVAAVNQIDVSAFETKVSASLTSVQELLTRGQSLTETVASEHLVTRLDHLLGQTSSTVGTGLTFLKKYQKELPAIKAEIHSANDLLNHNMGTIVGAINTSATLYQDDLPLVRDKLNLASQFIETELPGIETDILATLGMVDQKLPKMAEALTSGSELIEHDWPKLRKGIGEAAKLIHKGEEEVDLGALVKILKYDAAAESDFLANPVLIKQTDIFPIANNGSASAPFYTALCLWVGAVLFSSIATTDFHLSSKEKDQYSPRAQFAARLGTFLVVAFFQALIVSVGNIVFLGIQTDSPVYFVLFSLLIGLVFMAMVYTLVALFGNLGKGAAVIILVLSISAGGGNYPIEMSGPFFRLIHPYLPFTHAVNLLREPVGGILWLAAAKAFVILSLTGIFSIGLGLVAYPKVKPFFRQLNETLKEGHLLH